MYPFDWSVYFKQFADDEEKFSRYTRNSCEDMALQKCQPNCNYNSAHKQSPIQVQLDPRAPVCDDRHTIQTTKDGTCKENELNFEVTPTGLRADLDCTERPEVDFSRNLDYWEMRSIEFKVPAEHEHRLDDGTVKKFDAEIHLIHTGTGEHNDEFGIVAIWLKAEGNIKNGEVEKYILKWESALELEYKLCAKTYIDSTCTTERGYRYIAPNKMEEWERITFDNFESGTLKNYEVKENALISAFPGRARSGDRAIRIRDEGIEASFQHSEPHDVRKFQELQITFYVYSEEVKIGQSFLLEYSSDDGESYLVLAKWSVGTDIVNNKLTRQSVTVRSTEHSFTNRVRLRFRSNTSSPGRRFYIDDIDVLGRIDQRRRYLTSPKIHCSLEESKRCCTMRNHNRQVLNHNPMTEGGWVTISRDSFDHGYGGFELAYENATNAKWGHFPELCSSQSNCIRLRKERNEHLGGLIVHKQNHNLTGFNKVHVSFWARIVGFEKGLDVFALDYSDDGGITWIQVKKWICGLDVKNNNLQRLSYVMTSEYVRFTNQVRLRLRADASSKRSLFYIDDVDFYGWSDNARSFCSREMFDACCGQQLENDFETPEAISSKKRRLTNSTESGKFSCNENDFYCPYRLYRQTNNPVRVIWQTFRFSSKGSR